MARIELKGHPVAGDQVNLEMQVEGVSYRVTATIATVTKEEDD